MRFSLSQSQPALLPGVSSHSRDPRTDAAGPAEHRETHVEEWPGALLAWPKAFRDAPPLPRPPSPSSPAGCQSISNSIGYVIPCALLGRVSP